MASLVHKWLALLVGLQIVFWVVSGLFFTLIPIELIRSENFIRNIPAAHSLDLSKAASLAQLRGPDGRQPTKLAIETRPGLGQVIVAEFGDASPVLYGADTLIPLSPISGAQAASIARAHVTLTEAPRRVDLVEHSSPEYRGALPAWRVQFHQAGLAVYVSANTGAVAAKRSNIWRLYDTLWALHIMDWRNHENFNHPLIIIVTATTLMSVLAGIALFPYRLRFGGRPFGRNRPVSDI